MLLVPSLALTATGDGGACCGPTFHARRGKVLIDGKPIRLRGVSWFGFEGDNAVVDGLWRRPMERYLDFVQAERFNALRLPLALNNLLANPRPPPNMLSAEPALRSEDMLSLLDTLVQKAARRNILVLLDMHRLNSSVWPDPRGLWYNGRVGLEELKAAWSLLARRFCKNWNVFGADL